MESTGALAQRIADRWWLLVVLGLVAIVAGILAIAYPDLTLLALGIILGVYLLFWGGFTLARAFDPNTPNVVSVVRVLVGFLGLLAGLICLVRPGASVLALVIALSFWFILTGVADLVHAIEHPEGRGLSVLLGVLSIAAGVIIVANPDIGLTTLALLAGIGLLVRGTLEVVAGMMLRTLRGRATT
jgi:uncharacterized membrane protein HdeD (DUF308 family)